MAMKHVRFAKGQAKTMCGKADMSAKAAGKSIKTKP